MRSSSWEQLAGDIDLRAVRALAMRGLEGWNPDLIRTIHGYDAGVIWKGAYASANLR